MPTMQEIKMREKIQKDKPLVYNKIMKYEDNIKAGKSIAMLQIQPSYNCNFTCKHCSVSCFRFQRRETLTLEEIEKLCNDADEYGLAQLDLTGGEPLVFKNLEQILKAIKPERFYLAIATNGWELTADKAVWLKQHGVDRILLSLDSLEESEHDDFRNKWGSWKRAISAIDNSLNAGLDLKINTVITHERVRSKEFDQFLKFIKAMGARLEALPAKPAGEWQGRTDILLTKDDEKYLSETYGVQLHTSKHYDMDLGCLAVKKIIVVTAYGDVIPCIWMYYSLGNIKVMPFKDIMAKGMNMFGAYYPKCRMSDPEFLEAYNKSIQAKILPIPIEDIAEVK